MAELIYKEECYGIVGACFEVYKEKGCGFLEAIYQECLELELDMQGIPFVPRKPISLTYKGRPLRRSLVPDLICYEKIVLELKVAANLIDEHRAQVLNYLHATKFRLGLLINFGHYPKLEYERIVL